MRGQATLEQIPWYDPLLVGPVELPGEAGMDRTEKSHVCGQEESQTCENPEKGIGTEAFLVGSVSDQGQTQI